MRFLLPAAWPLLALGIPVVLLYLIRQRMRRRAVPTLLFWNHLPPQVHNQPLWRKLRRLLSLLLQLLILAILVGALARPLLPGQGTAASSLVVVLDPSITMAARLPGGGTRWDEALQTVRTRIDRMGFGDEATILLASDPPQVLLPWTGRRAELRKAVGGLHPGPASTDIRPALRLARNLAASRARSTVELVSDAVWTVAPGKEALAGVRIDRIGDGKPLPNSGITLFSARPLPTGAGEFQLVARLEQNTGEPVSGELTLLRDGSLMDVLQVTIPPGAPWQRTWRDQSPDGAAFEARWKPQGPVLFDADKAAQAKVDPVRELRIALVSPESAFLQVALASQASASTRRIWPPEEAAQPDGSPEPDLWIFNHAVPPAGFQGKAVVLINPEGKGFWGERIGPLENPLVSETDKEAPFLRFVDFGKVRFLGASEFAPAPGAKAYVDAFGKPLLFGNWEAEAGRRWLVLAFDLDQSDLVFRTAFPILCGNLLQTLRPEEARGAGLPGPVATRMKPLAPEAPAGEAVPKAGAKRAAWGWWLSFPGWWWFAAGALAVLIGEWFLYSRRVTE